MKTEVEFRTKTLSSKPFKMCSNWLLTVELKVNHYPQTELSPKYANILLVRGYDSGSLLVNGLPCHARLPGIFQNSLSQIVIQHCNKNSFHSCIFERPESNFILTLSESNGQFRIKKDNITIYEKPQASPTNFNNVRAEVFNYNPHHVKPSGWYKNFQLWTHC